MAASEAVSATLESHADEVFLLHFMERSGRGSEVLAVEALGSSTLWEVTELLCTEYIEQVRDEGILDHLWSYTVRGRREKKYQGPFSMGDDTVVEETEDASTKLAKLRLRAGSQLEFTYDYGTTLALRVDVVDVRPVGADEEPAAFPRVKQPGGPAAPVPAGGADEGAPPLDALFPGLAAAARCRKFSKLILGSAAEQLHGAIEGGPSLNGDQLYCPLRFPCLEHFLVEAEAAWVAGPWGVRCAWSSGSISEGWVSLFVFPAAAQSPEEEGKLTRFRAQCERMDRLFNASKSERRTMRMTAEEEFELHGPVERACRMEPAARDARIAELRAAGFDFAARFPKTHARFADPATFHWAVIHNGARQLEVVASKIAGPPHDRRASRPVATYSRAFGSLEEIMRTIEASWP